MTTNLFSGPVQVFSNFRGIAAAALLLVSGALTAAPLDLTTDLPDILVSDVTVRYDAVTGDFRMFEVPSSTGFYQDSLGGFGGVSSVNYVLKAAVDNAGNYLGGGTVLVQGDVGSGLQNLVTGDITAFGFDGVGNTSAPAVFEFTFDVTSVAVQAGLDFGNKGGIIFTSSNILPAQSGSISFANNFSGTGNTDNFAIIPANAPLSALLSLIAAAGLAWRRKQSA